MLSGVRPVLVAAAVLCGCAGGAAPSSHGRAAPPRPPTVAAADRRGSPLEQAWASYEGSRYAEAEAQFRALATSQSEARLGLATVLLMTGRYAEAEAVARDTAGEPRALALDLVAVRGAALQRQGKLGEAEAVLASASGDPAARRVRLAYAEVLLEQGRPGDAEPVLMTLVDEYNRDAIDPKDGKALAMVGRAAMLLGSPEDANDAFKEAENAGAADDDTLLWRADLFLDNWDSGHAEEVLDDLFARAPKHPEALVRMAEVKLDSNLDFDEAEKLATAALAQNPRLARAQFVLGGIALRDMNLRDADAAVDRGLSTNDRDLDLLSLRAATRFLADDRPGFERAKEAVLSKNPRYSRLYQIIGEYAEWEHRYEEIVAMMREALLADREDAKVRAQLGFNLIRAGEEKEGVAALARAFEKDPFNVRVFNTLNLYEKDIPRDYESVSHGRFNLRYSKSERALLDRYVPDLLERAWAEFTKKYAFTPTTPVGVELYPKREHFAIRTSGLPQTFIQGVCFGRTLAAMSPRAEKFNLGMTLWHELAHVFHIQLSKNHVPRWFTEGLAEYETLVARPEWRREHDAELYEALSRGKVPALTDLNRAFTHAEDMQDMATAYYASTQVVRYVAGRFGMPKVRRMLELWGEGKRTPDVVKDALSVSIEDLDREFRAWLLADLARYKGQFMPKSRAPRQEDAERAARATPKDPDRQADLALSLLASGKEARAKAALDAALALDAKHPMALWLSAQLAKAAGDRAAAARAIAVLLAAGHDGFAVRVMQADLAGSLDERRAALVAAHHFDPLESTPLHALAELAQEAHDEEGELAALRQFVVIEENDGEAHLRLMTLLLRRKAFDEARRVGESALWADIESAEVHRLYGEALAGPGGAGPKALFEMSSAVLGSGTNEELYAAHRRLADLLDAGGDRAAAAAHRKTAVELAKDLRTGPI